jgi:hypothetical protein
MSLETHWSISTQKHTIGVALLHFDEGVLDALDVVDGQREEDDLRRVGRPACVDTTNHETRREAVCRLSRTPSITSS